IDLVLRGLHHDRVLHAALRVQPERGRDLAAARNHHQQAVGDVALSKAEVLRLCPIDVDVEAGIARGLLDARIGDTRYEANAAQELGRVVEVRDQIGAPYLQFDGGGRAEIQDLTDDIRGQEGEGGPREAHRQPL